MATVLVPLAQGCEELEAVTVIDLLRRAGIEVVTATLDGQPVRASRGVTLIADTALDRIMDQEFDMIILPGGSLGADHLDHDPRIRALLVKMAKNDKYTAAICAAPKVLGHADLLRGRKATGYPGVLDAMGLTEVTLSNEAVVKDGKVITSRGPGTAMDFALSLIEILVGKAKRDEVETALVRS
jgi:protein deglycase